MLFFPINLKVLRKLPAVEFPLNKEWRLHCEFKRTNTHVLRVFIETNQDISSEEILISGSLSLTKTFPTTEGGMEFSLPMQKGIPSKNFVDLLVPPKSLLDPLDYFLYGTVIITSNRDKYADVLDNEESGECNQSKPLGDKYFPSPTKSLVRLSNDFQQLLDPKTNCFSDVNLICGNVTIPAHKAILSARSTVFAGMFKKSMKENHGNQVDIVDVDVSVLRLMISYIYTGKTSDLTATSAIDLLYAAENYNLQELKEVCCDFLKGNVNVQNVLKLLVLGDLHSEDLKLFAMSYISDKCENFSTIENTEEWKSLRKERPSLVTDVLTFLVKNRDKK